MHTDQLNLIPRGLATSEMSVVRCVTARGVDLARTTDGSPMYDTRKAVASPMNVAKSPDRHNCAIANRLEEPREAEPTPDWFVPKIWQLCLDWLARDLGAAGAGLLFLDLGAPVQSSERPNTKTKTGANAKNDIKVWATVGDAALPRLLWLHDHGSRPVWSTCMRRIPVEQWVVCDSVHGLTGDTLPPINGSAHVVGAKLAQGTSTVAYVGFNVHPEQASALVQQAQTAGSALAAAARSMVSVRDQGREAQWVRASRQTQVTQLAMSHGLTTAESTILHQMVAGSTCHDIARQRAVTVNTVKSQVKSIHSKLGVHRVGQIHSLL